MNRLMGLLIFLGISLLISTCYAFDPSCTATPCHQSMVSTVKLHQPVQEKDCFACHQQKNADHPLSNGKSFELTEKVPSLCQQCHDGYGRKKVVHSPVMEGDCLACHNPHGESGRTLLDGGEDQTELCLGCHESAPFKQKFMHGVVAVGSCTKCHDPHESTEKYLLKGKVGTLCLSCHADFSKALSGAQVIHSAVKDGPCASCHNSHGTEVAKLLTKPMPDLCADCHKTIVKKVTEAKVPHKPTTETGGCASCHSPHFSQSKNLLPSDEMTLCLSCHNKGISGPSGLKNIKKQLEGKKYLHGPIEMGECKACHDPHGSDNFRLLPGSYPSGLYAPYSDGIYGACLSCHEKNLLRFADTTIYTKFRNGNQNLHYLHVVNNRKGRTCRLCHEPHASNAEKLISSEGVLFGDWKIPLNFKITPTGGSCAPGCHRSFKYDRNKAEVYR